MSQLDNFRKSLGLPDPDAPVKEKKARSRSSRTVCLRNETFLKIRALSFWLTKEELMDNPTIDEIVNLGLDAYFEKEPLAKDYVDQNCPG